MQLLLWDALHCGYGTPIQRLFDFLRSLTRSQKLPLSVHLQNLLKQAALGLLELPANHLKTIKIQTPLTIFIIPKTKGIQRVLLVHFKDNIIFIDGGHVFFLCPYIIELVTKQLGVPSHLYKLKDAKE